MHIKSKITHVSKQEAFNCASVDQTSPTAAELLLPPPPSSSAPSLHKLSASGRGASGASGDGCRTRLRDGGVCRGEEGVQPATADVEGSSGPRLARRGPRQSGGCEGSADRLALPGSRRRLLTGDRGGE